MRLGANATTSTRALSTLHTLSTEGFPMKKLAFDKTPASLKHLSFNRLKDGEPGVNLSILIATDHSGLDPDIRNAIFRPAQSEEQMQLGSSPEDLVALRLKGVKPLSIEGEWLAYEAIIDGLLEGTEPQAFVDVKVKDITVKGIEGGSVIYTFKLWFRITDDESAALLRSWMNEGIQLTLTPPAVADDPEPQD